MSSDWILTPFAIVAIFVCVILLAVLLVATLPCLGFTGIGVAGGSCAASWMSTIGIVPAGGCFAFLQSLGALGLWTLLSNTALAIFAGCTGLIVAVYYFLAKYFFDYDPPTPTPTPTPTPLPSPSPSPLPSSLPSSLPSPSSSIPAASSSSIPASSLPSSLPSPLAVDGGEENALKEIGATVICSNLLLSVFVNALVGIVLGLLVTALWIHLRDPAKRARGNLEGPIQLPVSCDQTEDDKHTKHTKHTILEVVFFPVVGLLMGMFIGAVFPYHFF